MSETLFGRALGWLADAVCKYRAIFLYPQILLFGICVFYTVKNLQFDANRNDLVGAQKKYHQIFMNYRREFPAQDDLVVIVESDNSEKNRQFVERLGARLEHETNLFTDVFYKGDLKMLGPKALLFVPKDDLKDLSHTLTNYLPFIERFTQATNLQSLFAMVNSQFLHARREQNEDNDSLIKALPMLERIVRQATASLQRPGAPPSPGIEALFSAGDEAEQEIYITFAHGRIYLATSRARTEDLNGDAVEKLRELVAETSKEVVGVNVGITGEPVLEHDEMLQSQKDSTVASVISLLLCALIFIYGYQETGRPLKATICLVVGLGYTMGFTTLVVGHLNILTITFVPILVGLAIDFGVHLITRYEEELRHGHTEEESIHKAIVFTGQGIFTGALTTAAAFLAMRLTDFKGIQEMGIICGGGMIVCLVPMMTLLPVLLFRGRQNKIDHDSPPADLRSRIESVWLRRPKTVLVITLALCGLAVAQFSKVNFDYNLLNMQSAGLPAVVFEKKLIDSTPESVLFGAVIADSPQQAMELEAKLAKLPSVSTNRSMATYLTEDPTDKLKLIAQIKKEIAPVHFQPPDEKPVELPDLSSTLYSTSGYLGAAAQEVKKNLPPSTNSLAAPVREASDISQAQTETAKTNDAAADDRALAQQLVNLRSAIVDLRWQMLNMDRQAAASKLAAYQQALFGDVHGTFEALRNQDDSSGLKVQDLPPALRNRFIGVTGKYLIQVYPKADVWKRDKQEEFVKQLRSVDPKVTGTPVQLYEYTTLLKNSYQQAAWYALGAISIMVLLHFRNLGSVLLALLPVAVGSIWMGGLMGWFGIPFNPANIMTLPLVIGIGVTNGIHILNRFAEERNPGILAKSTGKAVLVSGLTTIAGFGSLMLAKHQGIRSLGYVMSIGVATCMIAGLTFLPAILNLLVKRNGGESKQPSDDNARSTLGREEPR